MAWLKLGKYLQVAREDDEPYHLDATTDAKKSPAEATTPDTNALGHIDIRGHDVHSIKNF